MLKTNSKQAVANLRAYIMTAWNINEDEQGRTWEETREDIKDIFYFQAYRSEYERKQNRQDAFIGWLAGLPRGLGDFYLCRAVQELGDILEETEAERGRYTEEQAETMLARLISKEVL